jgi:hypothetical protein
MRYLNIAQPPDPAQFPSPVAWQRAAHDWMQRTRGVIQDAHNEAIRPAGQQMRAENFALSTVANGTMVVADVANTLCTLIQVLTDKGLLSPTISRSSG